MFWLASWAAGETQRALAGRVTQSEQRRASGRSGQSCVVGNATKVELLRKWKMEGQIPPYVVDVVH